MASKKLPSFQFYPGDWRKDPALRRVTHAARGVWIDMLCLMFECDTRGVLATGGSSWSDEEVARAVGGDTAEVLSCIRELLAAGVASRNNAGAIVCRRLVRDEQLRHERSKAGSKGGSKTQANRQANPQANGQAKSRSSSSSSTSSSVDLVDPEKVRTEVERICEVVPRASPKNRETILKVAQAFVQGRISESHLAASLLCTKENAESDPHGYWYRWLKNEVKSFEYILATTELHPEVAKHVNGNG